MEFDRGTTTYNIMPIPPIEAQMQRFEIGAITIGVEYRLLDEAISAAHTTAEGYSGDMSNVEVADCGVSLHVFGCSEGEESEYLRFDCFDEDPHYHYVSYKNQTNQMVHVDPVALGDPLAWALERIRTRLPQMLTRAGAPEVAAKVNPVAIEAALPQIAEVAYRARFNHDDEAIHAGALARNAS
ncbi:MAG: hypothetical protein AB8G23_10835 [Myxococcota bacterium]